MMQPLLPSDRSTTREVLRESLILQRPDRDRCPACSPEVQCRILAAQVSGVEVVLPQPQPAIYVHLNYAREVFQIFVYERYH